MSTYALGLENDIGSRRILVLDYLRALAVLLVLWGHIFVVGINYPEAIRPWVPNVDAFAYGPSTVMANISGKIVTDLGVSFGLNPGAMGVSLFFIISGFVILGTVDRSGPVKFLIQRFFRIVPVCFAACLLIAGLTSLYCSYFSLIQPNTWKGILTSAFAVNYFNGAFSTTPVLWTLEVELCFYLVLAVASASVGRVNYRVLMFLSSCCLGVVAFFSIPFTMVETKNDIIKHFAAISIHLSYMLVGSVIYRAWESREYLKGGLFSGLAIVFYSVCYALYAKATHHSEIGANIHTCALSLVVFLVSLITNFNHKSLLPLAWVSNISYPLYLLHVPIGWALFYLFAWQGVSMSLAAILGSLVVVFLAWIMHHAVEVPFQNFGKRVSRVGGIKRATPRGENLV